MNDASTGGSELMECARCGDMVERAHPLDAVVHPDEPQVCDDCVELWDEVVDV